MKKEPLLTPLMRWFLLAIILANIAGTMTNIMMPIYLTRLGASITQVGMVFTLTSVVILTLQVFGGWISDTIGRLPAIAIGSLGGVLGFIAMLLAPSWHWMLLALAITQIPYALVGPSFSAFIAENSTVENRGKVYGVVDTVYQVVGVIGPPLGGFLAGTVGFKPMLAFATLFYVAAALLRVWMARTMRTPDAPGSRQLSLAGFASSLRLVAGMIVGGGLITWLFLTDGVRDIAFRMSGELQPLYLEQVIGMSLAQIGLLGSFFSGAMMLTPMLSGRLADRYGERLPICAGFLLMTAAYLVFLQSSTYPAFVLTWMLFGSGVGLLSPAYQSLISKVVPRQNLGAFSGLFHGSLGFIALPAPWIGARLWDRFSPRLPFIITAMLVFVTILPVWLKFRLPEPGPAQSPPVPDPLPAD